MRSKKRNLKNRIHEVTTLLMPIVFTVGWLLVGFWILRKSEHYENTYGIPRIVYF